MDVNVTLAEIRKLIKEYDQGIFNPTALRDLVELTDALDQWIMNGGFLPAEWQGAESGTCVDDLYITREGTYAPLNGGDDGTG